MKTLVLVGAAMFVSSAAAEDQCVPAHTAKSLDANCVHIDLPADVTVQSVVTIKVDPKTVASMTPLSQVDTVVKEVAVAE